MLVTFSAVFVASSLLLLSECRAVTFPPPTGPQFEPPIVWGRRPITRLVNPLSLRRVSVGPKDDDVAVVLRTWLPAPVGSFVAPPSLFRKSVEQRRADSRHQVADGRNTEVFGNGISRLASLAGLLQLYDNFPPHDPTKPQQSSAHRQTAPPRKPAAKNTDHLLRSNLKLLPHSLAVHRPPVSVGPSRPSSSVSYAADPPPPFLIPYDDPGTSARPVSAPSSAAARSSLTGLFVLPQVVVDYGHRMPEDERSALKAVLLKADQMGLIPASVGKLRFTRVPQVTPPLSLHL